MWTDERLDDLSRRMDAGFQRTLVLVDAHRVLLQGAKGYRTRRRGRALTWIRPAAGRVGCRQRAAGLAASRNGFCRPGRYDRRSFA